MMLYSRWTQGTSVRMWAEIELAKRDASEVLGFQDTGPGQSFMICFATQWQLEFAAARGGKAILVDATHSTNQLKVRACNISTANVFSGFFLIYGVGSHS